MTKPKDPLLFAVQMAALLTIAAALFVAPFITK